MDDVPAFDTRQLTKIYASGNAEVVAMRDASLVVARGEVVALLGPSGADYRPTMLSGGQQQQITVAQAMANQPSVMRVDELTAPLDSHRGRQVMELFRQVAHEHGTGVIVVTHDHRALDVFDTTYEMEDGVIRPATGSMH